MSRVREIVTEYSEGELTFDEALDELGRITWVNATGTGGTGDFLDARIEGSPFELHSACRSYDARDLGRAWLARRREITAAYRRKQAESE